MVGPHHRRQSINATILITIVIKISENKNKKQNDKNKTTIIISSPHFSNLFNKFKSIFSKVHIRALSAYTKSYLNRRLFPKERSAYKLPLVVHWI